MLERTYLYLIILCGILFPRIINTFTEENLKKSWNSYVRKKRLIDDISKGGRPVPIQRVPYIVNIKKYGYRECAGIILSPYIILTAAHCAEGHESDYLILSGSIFENRGTPHNVTRIITHPGYHPSRYKDDLALLIIFPPIDIIRSVNRHIQLHLGPLKPNLFGTVSGWGCNAIIKDEEHFPSELRSIFTPIISLEECKNSYPPKFNITDKEICTYDTKKRCSTGDSGAPLVVNFRLVGVYSWSGTSLGYQNPDVFMNVVLPFYNNWIMSYIHCQS